MFSKQLPLVLLTLLIAGSYAHTLDYPWHLDDLPNITQNTPVQLTELAPQTLGGSLFATPYSGALSRPFSYLSFALNYYYCKDNVVGYHLVNILIHIITSWLLYFSTILLLRRPSFRRLFPDKQINIVAFLTAVIWAVHPIQIQAITYIVQRMTSLATMGSMASIFFFLYSFQDLTQGKRIKLLTLSALCFIFAIGSKENVALLPISLLIIQLSFYSNDTRKLSNYLKITLCITVLFITLASLYYLVTSGTLQQLFKSEYYGSRPYTALERLLTQPRILIFYISLLIYPNPTRFSIDHSFELSTSLLHPWTTLPAIFLTVSALVIGLILLKKKPLFGFPILFFFINHIIESSVIPLELVFEHRNYLPSLFFFLPLAVFINTIWQKYKESLIHFSIVSLTCCLVLLLCWSTYLRNTKWSSEQLLWEDALTKAANNARPYSYLGRIYGWEKTKNPENLEKAVSYYTRAVNKYAPRRHFNASIIGNIGGIYLNYGQYKIAERYYKEALEQNGGLSAIRLGLASSLTLQGKFEEALTHINYVINKGVASEKLSRFYNLEGLIFLWLQKPAKAQISFSNAIANSDHKIKYYYNLAISFSLSGHYKQAKRFFQATLRDTPLDISIMLSIIENELRHSHPDIARKYATNLYRVFDNKVINNSLKDKGSEKYRFSPIDFELIRQVIYDADPLQSH